MAIDPLSPIAPARIRVLLLPVGRIRRSRFLSFVQTLEPESVIRLGDISPDSHADRTMFSPLAFPNGLMLWDFSTHLLPPSQTALAPFELFREPMGIIGIADADEYPWLSEDHSEAASSEGEDPPSRKPAEDDRRLKFVVEGLREQYTNALTHSLMLFNYSGPESHPSIPEGTLIIPPASHIKATTVKTALCTFASCLLAEMTTYAKSLQARSTIPSPDPFGTDISGWTPDTPSLPSGQRQDGASGSPVIGGNHRMSGPAQLPSSSGRNIDDRRGSGPISPMNSAKTGPATTFDDIAKRTPSTASRGSSAHGRSSTINPSRELIGERISKEGFGPGGANEHARIKGQSRVGIVIGNIYLCAGLWQDALRELVDHTAKLRNLSDYLWHAKGLESILATLLLVASTGMDFQIPQICYPGASRLSAFRTSHHTTSGSITDVTAPGQSQVTSNAVALQNLSTLIPDLVNMILSTYARWHGHFYSGDKELLPQVAYSEVVIRLSKLLTVLNVMGGALNEPSLRFLIRNSPSLDEVRRPGPKIAGTPSKRDIANILFRADPSNPDPGNVSTTDHVMILGNMASVLGQLGLHRKRAIVTKEFVASLIPGLVRARKIGAAEMGVHPAAGLSAQNMLNSAAIINQGGIDGDAGLSEFLTQLGCVYGIVDVDRASYDSISRERLDEDGEFTATESNAESKQDRYQSLLNNMLSQSSLRQFGNPFLKVDILRMCIRFCEALPDFQGVLFFTSMLLRTAGPGSAPGSNSTNVQVHLARDEQLRLATYISRTIGVAQKLNLKGIETDYWDDFLVRGIELVEPTTNRSLSMRKKVELDESVRQAVKGKDPFIHNPFSKKKNTTSEEQMLVVNESYGIVVSLQNPYEFEIEVETLTVLGEGPEFICSEHGIFVGPYRTQKVVLKGQANSSGQLRIYGCSAKVKGCRERIFPIFVDSWQPEKTTRPKAMGLKAGYLQSTARPVSGTSQLSQSSGTELAQAPKPSFLSLKVIPEQPILAVSNLSLPQSAIMVLEGESKRFHLTLHNTSDTVAVDFLHFTFQDSATAAIQGAMANKELLAAEVHELEIQLLQCPAFRLCSEEGKMLPNIPPKSSITVEIEVIGKAGLTNGTIQVDYACLGRPKSEVEESFYTRQLKVSINVTVNASVQLSRIDLLACASDLAWNHQQQSQPSTASSKIAPLEKGNGSPKSLIAHVGVGTEETEYFMVLLDLRNAWPNPLSVNLQVRPNPTEDGLEEEQWSRGQSLHELIQPGHVARLVVFLPKIYIRNPHMFIPSLNPANQRQFVVSATKISPMVEKLSRENFWYREELLKRIRGRWREDSSGREGELELRAFRLNPRLVECMKIDDLDISMRIVRTESSDDDDDSSDDEDEDDDDEDDDEEESAATTNTPIKQIGKYKFKVPTNTFLALRTTLTNRSHAPIHPLLRLQPTLAHQTHHPRTALDISKCLSWSGVFQRPLDVLMPGESAEVDLGLYVLCSGIYEVSALVDEIQAQDKMMTAADKVGARARADSRSLHDSLLGEKGVRRGWYAKEACVVVARDD